MIQGKTMLEIDNAIFDYLLKCHPNFVFGFRTKNTSNGRFLEGYKFQGDGQNYLSIGLVKTSGGMAATRAINFQYEIGKGCIIYVNVAPIKDPTIATCYKKIADDLGAVSAGKIFEKKYSDDKDISSLEDIYSTLKLFINNDYITTEKEIKKNCPDELWSKTEFEQQIQKTDKKRQDLQMKQHLHQVVNITTAQPNDDTNLTPTTMNTHPLNLILYGPPGTGKTYNTVNEALSIIEGKKIEDLQNENRENVLERFNKYKEEGRIVFTTFHQSLSYEEFIEGIKPIPGKEDVVATHNNAASPTPGATQFGEGTTTFENLKIMQYKPQDGIFKKLCDKALNNPTEVVTSSVIKKTSVVPITLTIGQLLDEFTKEVKAKGKIEINIDGKIWKITKSGKSFTVQKNENKGLSVTNGTIARDWNDFKNEKIKSANDIKSTRASKTGTHGTSEHHWAVYNALRDFENELLQKEQNIVGSNSETETAPYVLIIDEINRGNVSQIFGELITLIEEDKRTTKWDKNQKQYVDNPEKITVKLPYSPDEDPFGVPGNLYIIGTMNTADRSVEALDTALRRRFEFKEMMPKPELVKGNICGYDLKDIITTINDRIRVLKDREHQIGHSYFMKCKTDVDLKNVFKNNIVPLLQEYFYGNYAYIGLVLGNGFVLKDEEANNPKFATFDGKEAFENNTDTQYKLLDEEGWENLDMTVALQQLIG